MALQVLLAEQLSIHGWWSVDGEGKQPWHPQSLSAPHRCLHSRNCTSPHRYLHACRSPACDVGRSRAQGDQKSGPHEAHERGGETSSCTATSCMTPQMGTVLTPVDCQVNPQSIRLRFMLPPSCGAPAASFHFTVEAISTTTGAATHLLTQPRAMLISELRTSLQGHRCGLIVHRATGHGTQGSAHASPAHGVLMTDMHVISCTHAVHSRPTCTQSRVCTQCAELPWQVA
jgi:hypothetical protein